MEIEQGIGPTKSYMKQLCMKKKPPLLEQHFQKGIIIETARQQNQPALHMKNGWHTPLYIKTCNSP